MEEHIWIPTQVEGRVPDEAELELKRKNGSRYFHDCWTICREFQTWQQYGPVATDLEGLAASLGRDAACHGFDVVDSSDRLNDAVHCTQMAVAWHKIVHDARNSNVVHVVRRTPANSGPVLCIQRLESLRGQCTEFTPCAFIVLVSHQMIIFTRDRVLPQEHTERLLLAMIRQAAKLKRRPKQTEGNEEGITNMNATLFKQQVKTIEALMTKMCVDANDTPNDVNAPQPVATIREDGSFSVSMEPQRVDTPVEISEETEAE